MNSENNTQKNTAKPNNRNWRRHKKKKKPNNANNTQNANAQNETQSNISKQEQGSKEPQAENQIENQNSVPFEPECMVFEPDEETAPTVSIAIENDENAKLVKVTGVRFKANGKVYYFDSGNLKLKDGSYVIVNTARGLEFAEVAFASKEVKESSLVLPLREVVRVATKEDIAHNKDNKAKEDDAFKICNQKILKHGLDMKLIEAQYSFDNSKLLFYFTSSSRVDFRELVKDLAGVFKTRIELRQIGIRDEAKLIGGLGACGRPLCCSTFLSDFVQVSIRMAKEQNLSLNSGKISGCCGRLMCCLQYEYSTYASESAKTPPVDSVVKTANGIGYVTETNPLAGTIKVRLKDQPDKVPEQYNRDDVTIISRPSSKNDSD